MGRAQIQFCRVNSMKMLLLCPAMVPQRGNEARVGNGMLEVSYDKGFSKEKKKRAKKMKKLTVFECR